MGAVFAPTRFSLVRISIRDLVAAGKSLLWNSGVGGGGGNLILRKKHININKFAGLSRDWAGAKILFMCVCVCVFFSGHSLWGRKRISKVPPKNPGQSRENFVYGFSLYVFFRSQIFAGEVFLLTVGAFLLTVELLCLQSLKALFRRTFPV